LGVLGAEGKGVLTISGGLASFPRDGNTSEELFLQADRALLEAKRSGKNRIYLVGKPENNITEINS
jgi:PleD family two-component response regulator